MNSAQRLANLLHKIQDSKHQRADEVFEEIFDVNSCVGVTSKLRLCEAQISILKGKAHKNLIQFLRTMFGCKALQRNIQSERNTIPQYIVALETAAAYMPSEDIDAKNITELSELLLQMKESIDKADTQKEYKDVLYSYVDELLEGIVDIDIGGLDAFTSHVEIASGKVVLYNKAFTQSNMMEIVNKIYNLSTKILNDGQTWSGVIGFVGGKLLG